MSTIQQRFMKDDRITTLPRKEKDKIALLQYVVKAFQNNKTYSEYEVNQILKSYYGDYAILRRYLVDYAMLMREDDGKRYWVNQGDAL